MPEVRERKNSDKIKGKSDKKSGSVKKDVRRQMTAKYVKELTQRQKNRGTSGNTDTAPEVQAAEQVEETIYTTADSLRDRTATAVSKSISRHKRKQQKKQEHREQPPGEAPPAGTEAPPPPAGEHSREKPQEHLREKPASGMRTHPTEDSRRPAPMRERRPDTVRERPAASRPGPDHAPAGPSPKERMRHTAIKEKRNRQTDIRRRPADPTDQRQTSPPGRKPAAAQPKPQERMRQKAKTEAQTRRAQAGRVSSPPSLERQPAPRHIAGSTPASPGNQSINPIKERPRRSFAPKEKPTGGSFIPKTRQTAAASKSTAKAASAAKKKTATRPMELAKRRVQRKAQRKLLQQSGSRAKAALDLSRKAAVVTAKAVSSLISAIAGLLGGAFLIPIICLIVLVAAIIASPFGILFANEPTPGAMPLNVAVGQLNMELANTLETMQTGDYDSIDIQGQGPDWREVVAVFAARTAGTDDGTDVAALTPDRVDRLKAVFWDMCAITSEVETIPHPDSDPDDDTDDSWTERILHITITAKTAEDMRTEYAFTDYQIGRAHV